MIGQATMPKVALNIPLTAKDKRELQRRAVAAGYRSVSEYVRSCLERLFEIDGQPYKFTIESWGTPVEPETDEQ